MTKLIEEVIATMEEWLNEGLEQVEDFKEYEKLFKEAQELGVNEFFIRVYGHGYQKGYDNAVKAIDKKTYNKGFNEGFNEGFSFAEELVNEKIIKVRSSKND